MFFLQSLAVDSHEIKVLPKQVVMWSSRFKALHQQATVGNIQQKLNLLNNDLFLHNSVLFVTQRK